MHWLNCMETTMTKKPTREQKLEACSHYSTDAFENAEWDFRCPTPPVSTAKWKPEDWVNWVDGQGSWFRTTTDSFPQGRFEGIVNFPDGGQFTALYKFRFDACLNNMVRKYPNASEYEVVEHPSDRRFKCKVTRYRYELVKVYEDE